MEAAQRAHETFTSSTKGRDGRPGDGFEDARLRPGLRSLQRAVEQAYLATLATEEGRPCRPRLLYVHPSRLDTLPTFRLAPRDLTAAEIRQLCFAHGAAGALVWTTENSTIVEHPRLCGILPDCDPSRLVHWVIEGRASGGVDIWAGLDRLVSLRGGAMEVMRQHARSTLEHLGPEIGWFFSESDLANDWNDVVARILASGHGGSLWISKDAPPSDAMITVGYPIASIRSFASEPSGASSLSPGVLRIAHAAQLMLTSVAELANLDGAVLLNQRMEPRGFGAFIGTDAADQVFKLDGQREPKLGSSAITGGGRHRAAVSFCRRCAPALAVVVSSDGSVTMVSHRPGAPAPVSMTYAQVKGHGNAIALRKQYELGPTGTLEPDHVRQNALKL